jgi:hypothetical protein
MWESILEQESAQMTIWRMRIACWITTSTDIHSEYVTLTAFPLQQWLYELVSVLCYTYISCLFTFHIHRSCFVRSSYCKIFSNPFLDHFPTLRSSNVHLHNSFSNTTNYDDRYIAKNVSVGLHLLIPYYGYITVIAL